jgi:hypothetical protein
VFVEHTDVHWVYFCGAKAVTIINPSRGLAARQGPQVIFDEDAFEA